MTSESLTCPYCNASIAVTASLSAGQRIVCPRCGDTFPLRPTDSFLAQPLSTMETAITDRPSAASSPTLAVLDLSLRSRRSLGWMAALVVGFMLLMAGVGLTFMLMTQQQRRAYDTSRPPRRPGKQRAVPEADNPVLVAAIAPDKLAALRYLPSDVNLLLAARIAELQATSVGEKVLRDLLKLGFAGYGLENLLAALGLRLEDIDHFVFAARIDDHPIPLFYFVLRTAEAYDDTPLRQRFKGSQIPSARKKKMSSFRLPQKDVSLAVCFADERTLIVALFADQLESLPAQPAEDLQRLPAALGSVLRERREPVAPAWVAGHSSDWTKTIAGNFLGRMKKADVERLASVRTFAVWLVPDKTLEVKASVACKDEKSAQRLDEYFRSLHGPDAQFKTALEGSWLTMQFPTEADVLARSMKR